jgi:TolB-like protein/DNA-binding winged helix-turn-helix (wHTH) protein/cytochrome c-type biogenesis protein CcmH/NrfG
MTRSEARLIRFDEFEVDFRERELRKRGIKVRLQEQPLCVLELLLETPGMIVTREDLRRRIWAADTFVDFDKSLYSAINRLRDALGDSRENPRFLQTVPRRGYRFIASVRGCVSRRLVLAVLPFKNLSRDPRDEYLCDGITEELTTQLACLDPDKLSLIARGSVMHVKEKGQDAAEIGRSLRADCVLTGSTRYSSDRVRVSAQLLQVHDQSYLWGRNYDREMGDVLAIQNEIANDICTEVRAKLAESRGARPNKVTVVNPKANQMYLKGRYYLSKENQPGFMMAISLFEQCIAMDPTYAMAYAGLSAAHIRLGHWAASPPSEAFPMARTAAQKAIALDDSLAEAHTALADVHFLYEWDWNAAESAYRKAISLNPNSVQTLRSYSGFLIAMKRYPESATMAENARQIDPTSVYLNAFAAVQLYSTGQYAASIEAAKETLQMDSGYTTGHLFLGLNYLQTGRHDEAIEELQKAVTATGVRSSVAHVAYALALSGRTAQARKVLNELQQESRHSYVSPWLLALIYCGLGENDKVFDTLEECFRNREHDLVFANMWPQFDKLRSDPRWRALFSRLSLPQ